MSFRPWSWCQESSCVGTSSLERTAAQIHKGQVILGTCANSPQSYQGLLFDTNGLFEGVLNSHSFVMQAHHENERGAEHQDRALYSGFAILRQTCNVFFME